MATTKLSPQTFADMLQQLGGISLSPSELEGVASQLETLWRDVEALESVDVGEVGPETLFDLQGG